MSQDLPRDRQEQGQEPSLSFEGGTGFLLARVGSLARSRWARMLAERDLTPHHYGMLMTLADHGPLGQHRLSDLNGIDPRNAGPVIDVLDERHLISRETHPTDRRRRLLELTPAGREIVRDLTDTGNQVERTFLRALTAAEQAELHRMLLVLLTTAQDAIPPHEERR